MMSEYWTHQRWHRTGSDRPSFFRDGWSKKGWGVLSQVPLALFSLEYKTKLKGKVMNKLCPIGHSYSGDRCSQCQSTARRGYDSRWRRLSEDHRTRNPLCEDCEKEGRTTAASEVHHIKPLLEAPSLRLNVNNLVSLCRECHRKRHGKS